MQNRDFHEDYPAITFCCSLLYVVHLKFCWTLHMLYTLILVQINIQVSIHYYYHKVLLAQSGNTVTAISFSH